MNRRTFLQVGVGGLVGSAVPNLLPTCQSNDSVVYSGWVPNKSATARYIRQSQRPYFVQQSSKAIVGSGKGRRVLLYKYLERALGKIVPHDQQLGDCTGQAYGFGVDLLSATQIHGHGFSQRWLAKASTEAIYAGSRYEIGYEKYGKQKIFNGDGSCGLYCADFVRDYGVLARLKYGDIDLTTYAPDIAKDWGDNGVPDELEPIAKMHPVRSCALVRSYADCRDAISNGFPVIFCSSVGFNPFCMKCNPSMGRDSQGFLKKCGEWWHALCGIACDDTTRPGICLMNSWGPFWLDGPKAHGQPDGSFWVDAHTIDEMCAMGDSFAISGYVGFPMSPLNYELF